MKVIILLVICLLAGIVWSIYKFPSYYDTAKLVDGLGLKERTITALELKGNDSKLAELQKKDAINNLANDEIRKKIFIKPSLKIAILAMALIFSSIIVGFINTPSNEKALIREKNKQIIKNEIKRITKVEKELNEEDLLTLEEKEQIENVLKELKRKLDKSDNVKDIQKEALKAKKELKGIQEKIRQKKIEEIAKKLSDKEFTKELAENLKNEDVGKITESIDKMADQIKNMDKEQLENLAEDMAALAEELKNNPELSDAFNQLTKVLSQNIRANLNNANLSNSLNNLSEALLGLMNDSQVSGAISQLNEALSNLSSIENNFQGNNGSNGQSNYSGNQGTNQGNAGQSQGSSLDSGNGQGSGSGQSQGQVGGGTGAGEGSSAGNENSSGSRSSGQGGKKQGSEKEVKEYESIFTPKNLGREGEQTQVHGNINDSGGNDIIQVKKFGDIKGESMPYNQVLNVYKQNAYKRLDNEEIPPNMKEIIRKYFSDLE